MLKDFKVVPALAEWYVLQANGTFVKLWWTQDGAAAHLSGMVMERLQQLLLAKPLNDNYIMGNRV